MALRLSTFLFLLCLMLVPAPSYAKSWKHDGWKGHAEYERKGKVRYFDGRCIVEQKFKKHGGYEEKRKCRY